MAQRISIVEAKAKFSEVVDGVLHGRGNYVIERRGRPVAAIVSIGALEQIEAIEPSAPHPGGALAILGAWGDVPDSEIDAFLVDVRAERDRDTGRPVHLPR